MKPSYDLDKIKFATDASTFERAVNLYENGKVSEFKAELGRFSAVVLGGSPYKVFVSAQDYDHGSCTCYLGQNDTLCKHMVAVAIRAATGSRPLSDEDKQLVKKPVLAGKNRW